MFFSDVDSAKRPILSIECQLAVQNVPLKKWTVRAGCLAA